MQERSFPRRIPRYAQTPARPDLLPLPAQPGGRPVTLTPGRALIALLGELDACGLPVTGMNLTRLQGTLTLPGGLAVSFCCGWLAWPAGRPSGRGRPLHTLHNAHDPAGAARQARRLRAGRSRGECAVMTAGKPGTDQRAEHLAALRDELARQGVRCALDDHGVWPRLRIYCPGEGASAEFDNNVVAAPIAGRWFFFWPWAEPIGSVTRVADGGQADHR